MVRCLLAVLGSFFMQFSYAATVLPDLYEIEVPVSDRGAQERDRAIRFAMSEILIKVSGSQDLDQYPYILKKLDSASRYVQQYRYRESPETSREQPDNKEQLLLWVHFDGPSIDKLLQEIGLPLWTDARPSILVWLAVKSGDNRYVLSENRKNSIYRRFMMHAKRRGIPVLFPILDIEDRKKIDFSDVWGNFSQSIRIASQRYDADGVLVGRLYLDANNSWNARWSFQDRFNDSDWASPRRGLSNAIAGGIDMLADRLASHYAIRSGSQQESVVSISVSGVYGLNEYARLSKYFESISMIKKINLVKVEQDRIYYSLIINGTTGNLRQSFILGKVIYPSYESDVPDTTAQGGIPVRSSQLNYRLN